MGTVVRLVSISEDSVSYISSSSLISWTETFRDVYIRDFGRCILLMLLVND